MMLDALVRENAVYIAPADLAFVKDLIAGEPRHTAARYVSLFMRLFAWFFMFPLVHVLFYLQVWVFLYFFCLRILLVVHEQG